MNDEKVFLGVNNRGLFCYASEILLDQVGKRKVMEKMGLIRRYPVKVDLSGKVVMVEGDSHEDAVNRYLRNKK
jgi:hypothetical protein